VSGRYRLTWKPASSLITGRRWMKPGGGDSRKGEGEISPISDARGTAAYKRLLLGQLIKAHFLTIFPKPVCRGAIGGINMKEHRFAGHTRGESIYLDDIPLIQGTLFGAVYGSPVAHGFIRRLDVSVAERSPGVVRVLTFQDIKRREPDRRHHTGRTFVCRAACSFLWDACGLCGGRFGEGGQESGGKNRGGDRAMAGGHGPAVAQANGELIVPPRTFRLGDIDQAWSSCAHIIEGRADTNGQEHLYIENAGAYACTSGEWCSSRVFVHTGADGCAAGRLQGTGLPMHALDIEVTRLGGGFGGRRIRPMSGLPCVRCMSACKKAGEICHAPDG